MPSSFFKKLQTMVDSDENLENIPEIEETESDDETLEESKQITPSKGEPLLEENEPTPAPKIKAAPRKRKTVTKTAITEQPKEEIVKEAASIQITNIDEDEDDRQGLSLRERIREINTPDKSVFTSSESLKTSTLNSSTQIKDTKIKPKMAISSSRKWPEPEGQLAVDIFETENELVIQSAVAGVKPGDLDIDAQGDTVIIKGRRDNPEQGQQNYFAKECYWGAFSKEIIMPVEADASRAEAKLIDGILTIKIPKIGKDKKSKIVIK